MPASAVAWLRGTSEEESLWWPDFGVWFVRQNHFYWHLCGVKNGALEMQRGWAWWFCEGGRSCHRVTPWFGSGCRNLGSDGPPRQECGHRRPVGIWRTQKGEKHIVWVPSRGLEDPTCYDVCEDVCLRIPTFLTSLQPEIFILKPQELPVSLTLWSSAYNCYWLLGELFEARDDGDTHTHNLLEPKSPQNLRDPGMLGWRCCQLPTAILVGVGVCMMS